MPSFCAVINCQDKYKHGDKISFHKFPFRNKELLEKWISFANRGTDWSPSKWSSICSRHFLEQDFKVVNERRTLKKNAVPSIRTKAAAPPPSPVPAVDTDAQQADNSGTACRLCATLSKSLITFRNNFEIFGMIQKCFPTLNIQVDDHLSKDICGLCQQRLETFTSFVEQVYSAQKTLQSLNQQKRATEKNCRSERALNIKQEPVVRVKQEIFDDEISNNSEDLDIELDVNRIQEQLEQESNNFEQKFNLNNAQDIINNCDIMEIVNLDDAFIDIPDDDVESIIGPLNQWLQQNKVNEEHCYASVDGKIFKRESDFYKTEIDTVEKYDEMLPSLAEEEHFSENMTVAEVQEVSTQIPTITNQAIVTEINSLPTVSTKCQQPRKQKSDIVVLNESIVDTMNAFQFHECNFCQTKYFSYDSLQQHMLEQHANTRDVMIPMVSVPQTNLHHEITNLKTEKDLDNFLYDDEDEHIDDVDDFNFLKHFDMHEFNGASPTILNVQNLNIDQQQQQQQQEKINAINLKMLQQCENNATAEHNLLQQQQQYEFNAYNSMLNEISEQQQQQNVTTYDNTAQETAVILQAEKNSSSSSGAAVNVAGKCQKRNTMMKLYVKLLRKSRAKMRLLDNLANNYKQLTRSYFKLQTKCNKLELNMFNIKQIQGQQVKMNECSKILEQEQKVLKCNVCGKKFKNIHQLLQHKQKYRHFIKLNSNNYKKYKCFACDQTFYKKLALDNHRRYMCAYADLQTYKCRFCIKISLPHWRLLRSHEIKCKAAQQQQQQEKCTKMYTCKFCHKEFKRNKNLRQHLISHAQVSKYACQLCASTFKRSHGLQQHMRAQHMQLRPFICETCNRAYALKTDMLRCRHSGRAYKRTLNNFTNFVAEEEAVIYEEFN